MFKKITIVMMLSMFLFLASASASLDVTDLSVNPPVLWLADSDNVTISFRCISCDDAFINIQGPGTDVYQHIEKKFGTADTYEYVFTADKTGIFTAEAKGVNSTDPNATEVIKEKDFEVRKLEGMIIEPKATNKRLLYSGELSEKFAVLDVMLSQNSQIPITENDLNGGLDFEIFLNGDEIDSSYFDYRYDTDINHWIIRVSIPPHFSSGLYDLGIKAIYMGHETMITSIDSVEIKPSLDVAITSPTTNNFLTLEGTQKVTAKLRISHNGLPISARGPTINFYLDSTPIEVIANRNENDKYEWTLDMIIPENEPGKHDITVMVSYEGETVSLTETNAVHFVIPFSGRIVDSSGTVRHMKMDIESPDSFNDSLNYYHIENGADGRYNAKIIPGTYDMSVEFEGIKANFRNVEITQANLDESIGGAINYDIPKKVDVSDKGLKIIKVAVLEFDLPFDDVEIAMSYDDSKIADEEQLELYRCDNWNFGKGACATDWVVIPSAIVNPRGNIVLLNTTTISAFAIGERDALKLNIDSSIGMKDYSAGDDIAVKGVVTDAADNAVEGANVEIKIVGIDNISINTQTIISGNFKGEITLPPEEGIYNISVVATKPPYREAVKYFTIQSNIRKEISFVNVPDGEKIYVGEPFDIKFSLLNTGQVDLNNIRLFTTGLATEWYQILPVSVNKLAPGEEKNIELKLLVSPTYCENNDCKNYYPVTIQAKSDETVKEAMLTITLRQAHKNVSNTTATAKTVDAKSEGSQTLLGLEGLFTGGVHTPGSDIESVIYFVGIAMVIVLLTLSFRKRMRKSSPFSKNRGDVNLLHFAKEGVVNNNNNETFVGGLLGQHKKKED